MLEYVSLRFNSSRGQYLIYVGYFEDLKSCLGDMREKRKKGFPDAWVRVVPSHEATTAHARKQKDDTGT